MILYMATIEWCDSREHMFLEVIVQEVIMRNWRVEANMCIVFGLSFFS